MLGARLYALRTAKQLSQAEIARRLHLSRGAYSAYENNRRTPSLDILLQLAQYFHTTTDYLLGYSDDPDPLPRMDANCKQMIRDYMNADAMGKYILFRQHQSLQEAIRYGPAGAPTERPAPASPEPSSSRSQK